MAAPPELSAQAAADRIAARQGQIGSRRSRLAAVCGIDGSGKGHLTRGIGSYLRDRRFTVAAISVVGRDGPAD